MRHVLYLINHAGKAGTERYVYSLIANAEAYGVRPFFAYHERGLLCERVSALGGVPVFQVPMRNPFDLRAAKRIAEICRENQIEVIHTNYLRENYIAILAKRIHIHSLKVVYTNHFVIHNSSTVKTANRIMTKANHTIIPVCEAGARQLVENGNCPSKIVVIHNAVEPEIWNPDASYPEIRDKARNAYGISADEKLMICASRFAHDKGHHFFINAIELFAKKNQQAKILLAGDGPMLEEIKQRVADTHLNDMVRFIGFVEDIKSLFYAADFYVNPSQHEASSFLILEALASGLPVIAADMGGNREIINEENGCGILVEYDNAEMLCNALLELCQDPQRLETLREKAQETISRKHSLASMLKRTFDTYE